MSARFRDWLEAEGRAAGLPLGTLALLAALLHVGVTLLAVNPWHPDEHFQILEFAWARAGLSPLADLPWEFPARIRPTLQPLLALGALDALRGLGVESPYVWVLGLRLVTLALAFAVVLHVCARVAPTLGPAGRRTLWLSALFLWFLPLLTSRFTSENWGGLALVAAIPLLEAGSTRSRDYAAGALLGLSFMLRFQMAFACAALVLWLLWSGGTGRARALRVVAGSVAPVALGVLCDAWFYRGFVLTPWEYLRVNIFEGVAATFGTSPWYWYLAQAPLWMAPPLGIALAALCAVAVAARPRSPWVWAALAFLAGHSLVAHKELRFLFPLAYTLPVLAAMGVDAIAGRWEAAHRRWARAFGWAAAGQSAVLAVFLLTPSIHRGKEFDWHFYRFLWDTAESISDGNVYVLQRGEDPYRVWDLEGHVYHHPRVQGLAYEPGARLSDVVPPGVPMSDVLIVTRDRRPPTGLGPTDFELIYTAESGYRRTLRAVGLADSGLVRWLERVDRWPDSRWLRRVYRVGATPS
jgi:hypothetical protein